MADAPRPLPRAPVRAAPTRLAVEQTREPRGHIPQDRGERQDFGGARKEIPGQAPGFGRPIGLTQSKSGDPPMGQEKPDDRASAPFATRAESNLKPNKVEVDRGERQDFGDAAIEARARDGFVRKNPGDANAGNGLRAEPVPIDERTGETYRGPVPSGEAIMRDYIRRSPPADPPPKPKRGKNNRWYDHPSSGYPGQPAAPQDAGLMRWRGGR